MAHGMIYYYSLTLASKSKSKTKSEKRLPYLLPVTGLVLLMSHSRVHRSITKGENGKHSKCYSCLIVRWVENKMRMAFWRTSCLNLLPCIFGFVHTRTSGFGRHHGPFRACAGCGANGVLEDRHG
mmetsp:Transcript_859/g.563  ORF Transcript_859/g.563 Transcript_859/m.563 type:complete len:125 (-) Transcript_859:49-423(-)